jgi:hypothetical protein
MKLLVTAHDGTTSWKSLLEKTPVSWSEWKYSAEEIKEAQDKEVELPKIELTRLNDPIQIPSFFKQLSHYAELPQLPQKF